MEFNGTVHCDVVKYLVKRNKSNDGKTAFTDLEMALKRSEVRTIFGERMERLAFGSQYVKQADPNNPNSGDRIAHMQDKIKPNSNVIFPRHIITVDGREIREQPELLSIKPVDGEERVLMTFRIPLDSGLGNHLKLDTRVSETITVNFKPEQAGFDFDEVEDKGNGSKPPRRGKKATAEESATALV